MSGEPAKIDAAEIVHGAGWSLDLIDSIAKNGVGDKDATSIRDKYADADSAIEEIRKYCRSYMRAYRKESKACQSIGLCPGCGTRNAYGFCEVCAAMPPRTLSDLSKKLQKKSQRWLFIGAEVETQRQNDGDYSSRQFEKWMDESQECVEHSEQLTKILRTEDEAVRLALLQDALDAKSIDNAITLLMLADNLYSGRSTGGHKKAEKEKEESAEGDEEIRDRYKSLVKKFGSQDGRVMEKLKKEFPGFSRATLYRKTESLRSK